MSTAKQTAVQYSAAARKAQREAADPNASVWVGANAGTGKTQVLTDRVLRLLLAGTLPGRILALTYTKAAAAEMSKRVFDRLAAWVTMPDDKLIERLVDLLGSKPDALQIKRARHLFAAAIETPGGLKVQTIHAFSERLLQRFPLEAGIPPHFSILDDANGNDLRRQAVDAVLIEATRKASSPLGRALTTAVTYAADDGFDAVLKDALSNRDWLESMRRLASGDDDKTSGIDRLYRQAFDLDARVTMATTDEALAELLKAAEATGLRNVLRTGTTNDQKCAERIDAVMRARSDTALFEAMQDLFLTGTGEPRKSLVTGKTSKAHPQVEPHLARLQSAFINLELQARKLRLLAATKALITLASAVLERYDAAKARRAALDFDDLIRKSSSLLTQQQVDGKASSAEWVLFKLDGGLDHILVDEAQDTSPPQWQLIKSLADEFFSGNGSRDDLVRTMFAVGDEKQSIYGFQGAAPEMFARKGREFEARAQQVGHQWRNVPLNVSFRTTAPVLDAVDRVFGDATTTPGLTADATIIRHIAHRAGQAGLVEVWPLEIPDTPADSQPWLPLDETPVASPVSRLANRIASTVEHWLNSGETLKSENRPVRAGDILILVRKRQPFAGAMVAALKGKGIPVAGADRLVLTDQIAVEDLIVLGDFLTLPEDDLALATVLKSPLFGLDDAALTDLAHDRGNKSLWSRLLEKSKIDARFVEATDYLKTWRGEADFLPPYEFFASLLEREFGKFRRRMLARLGAEASDPIDELLNLALTCDEQEPPSLQGFLTWLRSTERQIKRDMEQGRDEVRIMTVHGAKGLEAPIVFLPDTCTTKSAAMAGSLMDLVDIQKPPGIDDVMLWPIKGSSDLSAVANAKAARADNEKQERNRLLYVALTRPRDRLYIAGFRGKAEPPPDCWYHLVASALKPVMADAISFDGRDVLRFECAQQVAAEKPRHEIGSAIEAEDLPEWALRKAPREAQLSVPLAPSRLAPLDTDETGEPVEPKSSPRAEPATLPPGLSVDANRFLRGTLTHALLEHLPSLPDASWPKAADAFLASRAQALAPRTRVSIVKETLGVLRDPKFKSLFGPDSQAEVPIVALIPRPNGKGVPLRLTGQIDRLSRSLTDVSIIDYKTNRPPPLDVRDVAEAYLLQLAAYRLALRSIFEGLTVRAAILWTDGPRIMEIPADMLDAAEQRLWQIDQLS
jgi:ATP-dependent helicase/nuclease subunit A